MLQIHVLVETSHAPSSVLFRVTVYMFCFFFSIQYADMISSTLFSKSKRVQHLKFGRSRKFAINCATGNGSVTCFAVAATSSIGACSKFMALRTVVSTAFMHQISIITTLFYITMLSRCLMINNSEKSFEIMEFQQPTTEHVYIFQA